jgi:hypothetical protein
MIDHIFVLVEPGGSDAAMMKAMGFTVTLYETSSCAWEFHHPGERRRWPDLRASLSQACRTTSPGTVGDDLLPTVSP